MYGGHFVLQSQRSFAIPETWSWILLLGILGYVLNAAFLLASAACCGGIAVRGPAREPMLRVEHLKKAYGSVLHGGNRMVQAFTVEALVNAIEKGDAPRAERAMEDHLLYLGDVLRMVET